MKPFKDTYVMYQLLEFVDESGIIVLCKASKKLNEICKQYIEIEDDKRFEVTEYKYYSNNLLKKYCYNNDIIKIKKMIKMMKIDLDFSWNWGLSSACRGGHIDMVKVMIDLGAGDVNWGLYCACRTGHMDIVKLMIEKCADDLNWGLSGACRGGHIDIVRLMIEEGAYRCCFCDKSIEEHLS